jgi:hypothetical protein
MGGRRGSVGAWVVALSGLALLLIMSTLTWYEVSVPATISTPPDVDLTFNAWEAFDIIDYGLLAVGVIALIAVAVVATRSGDPAFVAGAIALAAGVVGFVVLAYRAVDPPTLVIDNIQVREQGGVEIGTEIGVVLGLVAMAGIAIGGWLSVRATGIGVRDALSRLERTLGEDSAPEQAPSPPQGPS